MKYQRRIDNPLDIVIKLLELNIKRHIRQEAQDNWMILLDPSDRLIRSNTGLSCAILAARGRVHLETSQSHSRERPTPVRVRFRKPSTGSDTQKANEGSSSPLSCGQLISPLDERDVAASKSKAGTFSPPRGLMSSPCSAFARVDIPSLWKKSAINLILKAGIEAPQSGSLLPHHLAALSSSEDSGAAPPHDHPQLLHPHLVHSSILNPSGQT